MVLLITNIKFFVVVLQRDVLSQLEILEVAIETGIEEMEPPNERLEAKSANVYIKFKGMANVRYFRMIFEIGEHVERKAVVSIVSIDRIEHNYKNTNKELSLLISLKETLKNLKLLNHNSLKLTKVCNTLATLYIEIIFPKLIRNLYFLFPKLIRLT